MRLSSGHCNLSIEGHRSLSILSAVLTVAVVAKFLQGIDVSLVTMLLELGNACVVAGVAALCADDNVFVIARWLSGKDGPCGEVGLVDARDTVVRVFPMELMIRGIGTTDSVKRRKDRCGEIWLCDGRGDSVGRS